MLAALVPETPATEHTDRLITAQSHQNGADNYRPPGPFSPDLLTHPRFTPPRAPNKRRKLGLTSQNKTVNVVASQEDRLLQGASHGRLTNLERCSRHVELTGARNAPITPKSSVCPLLRIDYSTKTVA